MCSRRSLRASAARTIAENVEGRERYPINVRYSRDFRDNVEELRRVLIATPSGAQIPIGEVATISFSRGPAMIRDEDGALTGYVYIDLNTKRLRRLRCAGRPAAAAEARAARRLHLPMVRANTNSSCGPSSDYD